MDDKETKEYNTFRTGFTFRDIREMLWETSEDPKDWPHVTRHTVLGKWREIKLEMWNYYKHGVPK